jgi:hypothetical protein
MAGWWGDYEVAANQTLRWQLGPKLSGSRVVTTSGESRVLAGQTAPMSGWSLPSRRRTLPAMISMLGGSRAEVEVDQFVSSRHSPTCPWWQRPPSRFSYLPWKRQRFSCRLHSGFGCTSMGVRWSWWILPSYGPQIPGSVQTR